MSRSTPEYFLDEEIDRLAVPALKVHRLVLGDDGEGLFAGGVADMDFKAPPVVLEAMQLRLNHGVFGYEAVPDNLIPALITWLSTRHSWHVDPTHILRAPNILNSLAIAASLYTAQGDGIIVQPPVFFDFFDILRENHRSLIVNPLVLKDGRYQMDFVDLEKKASAPRAKMMYLCNPHNPVGRVWTRQELQTMGDICARHNVLVVSDEMHGDLVFQGHEFIPFASLGSNYEENSITCLSPAKTFNIASCCSAFTVIPDDDKRKAFQIENSRLTVNKNNAFASVAMEAAYSYGGPWLNEVVSYLQSNLVMLREHLNDIAGVELIEPEGTFLAWLDFTRLGMESDDLTSMLTKQGKVGCYTWTCVRGRRERLRQTQHCLHTCQTRRCTH